MDSAIPDDLRMIPLFPIANRLVLGVRWEGSGVSSVTSPDYYFLSRGRIEVWEVDKPMSHG